MGLPGKNNVPPVPAHVFEDLTGKRQRKIVIFLFILGVILAGFAAEFGYRVYRLTPAAPALSIFDTAAAAGNGGAPAAESQSVVVTDSAYTDCGQGLLSFARKATGIAGYIPFDDPTALSGLRARCQALDAVYYQAFSFGAADGSIRALGNNGAGFPLPEFNTGYASRNRPAAYPVLTPATGTAYAALAQIFGEGLAGGGVFEALQTIDLTGVDGGFCIDLGAYPGMSAELLIPFFRALNGWLDPLDIQSCLIGEIDAPFWQNQTLAGLVRRPLLLGFQTPDNPAVPVAGQGWFDAAAAMAQAQIDPEKLSVALGSFSTQWKSGRRAPVRMPFSDAMMRAGYFNGNLGFSAETGITNARYLDESRRLTQIWILDAVSFQNQRTALAPETQITLWPLGYEDTAIWGFATYGQSGLEAKIDIEAEIDLSDHLTVEGTGPFLTAIAGAVPGFRNVIHDGKSDRIVAQTYAQIPSPRRMRMFGDGENLDISVTFTGLGNARQTQQLIELLAQYEISATFFLSARELLTDERQVARLHAAGHTIGTNLVARRAQAGLPRFFSTLQNNLAQQLLQDSYGHHALLVKNPSREGQYPGSNAVLDQIEDLQSAGYIPVYSNISAPFGRFDPQAFAARVRQAAFTSPANVLSFDFSQQNDGAINAVLPAVLQRLVDDGFRFTTLPEISGLTPEQIFPAATTLPALRDQAIYLLMTVTWIGVQNFIFLLALIVALRSPIYLILAFMRRENFPFDSAYQPPVTIIIPAYNEVKVINKTLESVLASDYPDLKVIVVDDGSSDGTEAVVADWESRDRRVRLIRQENHGKWYAEDHALDAVDSDIFVIVDADTLLHKDAVKYLVQPFCDEAVGASAGTVEIGNRDNVITACQMIEYKISQNVMRRAYEVFNGILVVPGAIGAWRKTAVIKSGLVSGDTITEDADLTVALHRSGYKVVYAPLAKSYTEAPNSVGAFMQQRLRWSLGMLQVAWKHRGSITEGRPVGFVSIVDAVWYRIVSSLVYPLVDFILVFSIISWGSTILSQGALGVSDISASVILLFFMLTFLDVINLAAAFWFERKFEWKLLFLVPFLRFGYRQLLYISSMRSIIHAISGRLRGWQKLIRTDTATMMEGDR